MRLLRVRGESGLDLVEYDDRSIPPYAILSHTWGAKEEEVSHKDLLENDGTRKTGYQKLTFCAKQAVKDGLSHLWVDTCCIDKSSSAELAEAINSMFRWYHDSAQCYVYLSDVTTNMCPAENDSLCSSCETAFRESKWFTRGWTLQELLAPRSVRFFSKEEKELGDKSSLETQIHEITHIPVLALRGTPMRKFCINERLTWTNNRRTTREEDMAYSLLGILGISMVPIYGETVEAAFRRLRREVNYMVRPAKMTHNSLCILQNSTQAQRTASDSCSNFAGTIIRQMLESSCNLEDVVPILPYTHPSVEFNQNTDPIVCKSQYCSHSSLTVR